jgi:hypothetical protein
MSGGGGRAISFDIKGGTPREFARSLIAASTLQPRGVPFHLPMRPEDAVVLARHLEWASDWEDEFEARSAKLAEMQRACAEISGLGESARALAGEHLRKARCLACQAICVFGAGLCCLVVAASLWWLA